MYDVVPHNVNMHSVATMILVHMYFTAYEYLELSEELSSLEDSLEASITSSPLILGLIFPILPPTADV